MKKVLTQNDTFFGIKNMKISPFLKTSSIKLEKQKPLTF